MQCKLNTKTITSVRILKYQNERVHAETHAGIVTRKYGSTIFILPMDL